ncbi:DUF4381 domain-containing protein [Shewanella sp. UCD-KL12]|uniref:DUF4381 domain-containing protein n=1 Tax=Shewanella sp. UCD-KL12 TaxID=1917163 RepID=UPI000970FE0C|nr:DUF4381 domain-containing protein [Shewanella sp. UCD-KL12]
MTPTANPALEALKDIQAPEAISNLPIAAGYWFVMFVVLGAIVAAAFKLKQHRKHNAAKREVISQLQALPIPSDASADFSIQINSLIKRAAMSYLSREQVAGLQGDAWHLWMSNQVKNPDTRLKALLDRRYQREALSTDEAMELKDLALTWLQQALPIKEQKPNSNQQEAKC